MRLVGEGSGQRPPHVHSRLLYPSLLPFPPLISHSHARISFLLKKKKDRIFVSAQSGKVAGVG